MTSISEPRKYSSPSASSKPNALLPRLGNPVKFSKLHLEEKPQGKKCSRETYPTLSLLNTRAVTTQACRAKRVWPTLPCRRVRTRPKRSRAVTRRAPASLSLVCPLGPFYEAHPAIPTASFPKPEVRTVSLISCHGAGIVVKPGLHSCATPGSTIASLCFHSCFVPHNETRHSCPPAPSPWQPPALGPRGFLPACSGVSDERKLIPYLGVWHGLPTHFLFFRPSPRHSPSP